MADDVWTKKDLSRRGYYVEGDIIPPIEVVIKINGKVHSHLHFTEPGLLAIVSKPGEAGLWIERVEPNVGGFVDIEMPEDKGERVARDWQLAALGVPK